MVTQDVTNLNIYYHLDFLTILDLNNCIIHLNSCSLNGQCVIPPGASEEQCVCNPGFFGNRCQCK